MAWRGGFDGKGHSLDEVKAYVEKQPTISFAKKIVIHNTDFSNIKAKDYGERKGYDQRIANLKHYYQNQKRWPGGPHAFIEPDGKVYWGTPLGVPGVGSPSHNTDSWHIEIEADFDVDDPHGEVSKGQIAGAAYLTATLLKKQKLACNGTNVLYHKEDPRTTHNCPGPKFPPKPEFLKIVQSYMDGDKPVDLSPEARPPVAGSHTQPKADWTTKEVQENLKRLGYDPGPIDDIWGKLTTAAYQAFQRFLGVLDNGIPGPWVVNKARTLKPSAALSEAPSPIPTPEPEKPLSGEDPNQLKGRDRPLYVKRVLQDLGWKDFQAAAIVGNLMRESYPDLRTHVEGDLIGGVYTAIGIAQWRLDRKENLLKQAKAQGKDPHDLDFQARFVDWELRHTERLAGDALKVSTNLESALEAAIGYERPAKWTRNNPRNGDGWDARKKFAESLL